MRTVPLPAYLTRCLIVEHFAKVEAYESIKDGYVEPGERRGTKDRIQENVDILIDRRIISDYKSFGLWLNDEGHLHIFFHYKVGNDPFEGWKEFSIDTSHLAADKVDGILTLIRVMES